MNEWRIKTLGEVCSIARGGSPRPIQAFLTNAPDGINWVKISDATASGKYIYATAEKIKPAGATRSRTVADGDFLLSNSMSFGRPYIMRTSGCVHDGWLVLSKYQELFCADFLYHLLGSPQVYRQFDRLAAGSTVRNLNIDLASRVLVPVPPMEEQQRIVAILDEAFEGIATAKANAEKSAKNARKIFDGYLAKLFADRSPDWIHTTVGASTRFIDYRGKTPNKTNNGLRLITAKNVKMGYLQTSPKEFVSPDSYDGWMTRGIPRCGDVLFTTEAPLANVAQLDTSEKVVFAQRIIVMQPNLEILDSTFLKYLLLSDPIQRRIHSKGTGATVQGIKASLLRTIEISFPASLERQVLLVNGLDALRERTLSLSAIYDKKIAALDELKQSLLHQAFSGQL